MAPDEPGYGDDELDPIIVTVLLHLWTAWQESPDMPWSLRKLGWRAEMAMSTVRRSLSRLQAAGLVELAAHEDDDRATAMLSPAGVEFSTQLFRPE